MAKWDSELRESRFSGLDGNVCSCTGLDAGSLMLSTVVVDYLPTYPPAAVLTSSQNPIPKAEELRDGLKGLTRTDIAMENLMEANLQDQGAIILTWGDPFLSDIKHEDLDRSKSLMTHTGGFLWVNSSARSHSRQRVL